MSEFGTHVALSHEQWQLLVDVLDGNYDRHTLETAQDVLTLVAPPMWLYEADVVDEAQRIAAEHGENDGMTG